MRYYPIFLDLQDRPCLVIGTGRMAEEKSHLLEQSGARVIRHDTFDPEKIRDVLLIVAVVEDADLGRRIKEFADRQRILVNVVDQAENCTFIAPAIVNRGNLLIGISTSGKSPAMATRIRKQLEKEFGEEYSELLEALAEIRPRVRERFASFEERKAFYTHLVRLDLLETLKKGGLPELKDRIEAELDTYSLQVKL